MAGMIVSLLDKNSTAERIPPFPLDASGPSFPDDPEAPTPVANGESEDVFVFPATAAQRRFWLLDQLVPGGNPALNMPLAVRLTGRLDTKAMERSFQEIVRRHEVLRTTFHCEKGQLRQIIAPTLTLPVPVVDVRDFPVAERPRVPEHLMEEEAQRTFDVARGPAIRARLVRLTAEEHLLLITVHHIVSDGWSNGVLLRELGELYNAFVQGKPSPLPDLPIQFADFAQWQQVQAAEADTARSLAYWRETLAGELPVLDLPTCRPRRSARGRAPNGGVCREVIPAALMQSLKSLAVREGVSAYMLHLAVFNVLLGRYSGGQEDILVSTPSANRSRREIEPLIGLFVNPLLLRADLSGDPTFRELLGRVRRTVLGAFEHADASFEKLVEELQPRLVQANFSYETPFLQSARISGLTVEPLDAPGSSTLGEWNGAVTEDGTQTKFSIAYDADLFDAATVDRVVNGYLRLLEAVAAPGGLETKLSRLPVEAVPPQEQRCVLLANRWRLPAASARWMDGCFEGSTAREGELGRAREGVEVMVLDRFLQASPVGVVGEIYVRGLPAATRQTLGAPNWVEHPQKGTLLKTGDLARRVADGRVEWLGREDEQVRVHGFRVDAHEIESALQAHPHITEAAVLSAPTGTGGARRFTAFFQSDGAPPALLSHGQLRDFLRETLPEELIPAAFVLVERFPLTTDGRLDAAALPGPAARSAMPAEAKYDDPYLTIHYQIIEIWRELLPLSSIGIRDDFFALGGNSLLAMRMLYRIEQACGKALLPATLFQEATIEHLADEILHQDDSQVAPDVVRICETGSKTPIFYLHGDLTGGGYYCMKLSRRLGADQPFYALPPLPGTEVRDMPSIGAMAAVHLKTLRSVRPHGPYVIGGFCVGGMIAQEMARELAAAGEQVDRLLIIDATVQNRRLWAIRRLAERIGRLRGWNADRQLYFFCRWHFLAARLQRWTGLDARQQRAIFRRRLGNLRGMLGDRWRRVRQWARPAKVEEAVPMAQTVEAPWFDPRWDVPLVYLWAVGGYVAPPYAGPTTLLLSADLASGPFGSPVRDWKKCNPRLESRALVGSHLACITEHVDGLAETIRACLEEKVG